MKIIVCNVCCGYGKIEYDVGSHKSEYKTVICQNCKGSGRLEETHNITRILFEPGSNKSQRKH